MPNQYGPLQPEPMPGLAHEQRWRAMDAQELDSARPIVLARWLDNDSTRRREHADTPSDRWVVSLALRSTRLRFSRAASTLVEGRMPAGTLHVTAPARAIEAEFCEPCDFIHLYVARKYLETRASELSANADAFEDMSAHDPIATQLGRTLVEARSGGRAYEDTVGQTILTRLLMNQPGVSRVNPLPKWRVRRVHELVDTQIDQRITLASMAAAAGLSRMHFAAQFRAATGVRPHEYLLQQRIERAKVAIATERMGLAEVALSVGFQTQSHFSTVFKRLTGETPGQWRRADQAASRPSSYRPSSPAREQWAA